MLQACRLCALGGAADRSVSHTVCLPCLTLSAIPLERSVTVAQPEGETDPQEDQDAPMPGTPRRANQPASGAMSQSLH